MNRTILTALAVGATLGAIGVVVLESGEAEAQKTVTFQPPAAVHHIELSRAEDGSVRLKAYARSETPEGAVLDRAVTCETDELTAAQRTALATIRTAALACWRSKALDGGL